MVVKLTRVGINLLLSWLIEGNFNVIGTKKRGEKYVFDKIDDDKEFTTDYVPTILPMKKYFIPPKEVLFNYNKKNQTMEQSIPEKNQDNNQRTNVYIGLRGCDMESINILDDMMVDNQPDSYYKYHRKNSLFFVFDCAEPIDNNCFCYLLNKKNYDNADVVFYQHEDGYLVRVNSDRAEQIFNKFSKEQSDEQNVNVGAEVEQLYKTINFPQEINADDAYDLMDKKDALFNMDKVEAVCEKEANNCLSCGSCFMVCPTCYCFTIKDVDEIKMDKGQRIREWDGCMLEDFSLVAGGHRLVKNGVERSMHKFNRKYKNALMHHQRFLCVGCGRCSRACPTGNNFKSMINEL